MMRRQSQPPGRTAAESADRKELQRRPDQSYRLAAEPNDPLTKDRLDQFVRDLEEQLRLPKAD
jgi:hypothetical protein